MTKAIIYTRSRVRNSRASTSYQFEACRGLADRLGWQVVSGVSDTDGRMLAVLTERIEAGKIEAGTVIIIASADRLPRRPWAEAVPWMAAIADHGIRLALADSGAIFDGVSDAFGFVAVLAKAEAAHEESSRRSARAKAVWANRKSEAA